MAITLKKNKKGSILTLPEVLDPLSATILKDTLLEAFAHQQPITLKNATVTDCHSLCLQLLVSAQKTAQAQGTPLILEAWAPSIEKQVSTLGLTSLLANAHG